jgi:hypothetical protein
MLTPSEEADVWAMVAREEDEERARVVCVNRAVLSLFLRPEDRTRRGVIRWRRLSTLTGIPVALFKRWWWGEESMSTERIGAMHLHELSIASRTGEPTESVTVAGDHTGSRKPTKHVVFVRLRECGADPFVCQQDDGDRPLLSVLLSPFL